MLVGDSPVMVALRDRLDRVARTDFTVLIAGESGVGKELAARHIHLHGPRRRGPFVAVNCAAIVDTLLESELFGIEEHVATGVRGRRGKFELAEHGTLFLDEVGDLAPPAQAKLLRVLQDLSVERVGGRAGRRVDVRIIAATNRPLDRLVANDAFRADLYYRLCGVEVAVPALRERRSDVPALARHLLGRAAVPRRVGIRDDALEALRAFDWPGNVRQLARVLERAVALSSAPELGLDDLPGEISTPFNDIVVAPAQDGDSLRVWARRYARYVLDRHGGNRRQACAALGISHNTLKAYLQS